MTTIEMQIDRAKQVLYELGVATDYVIGDRKLLIGLAEEMKTYWQSGSADEFDELHKAQMNLLWSKIQTLIQLSNELSAAIAIAEQTDAQLSGG